MNYLAHIIRAIKPRYTHFLLGLLLCALPISTTHVTSLEKKPTTQHQTPQGLLPKEYILQNPLVALLTLSDYAQAKPKISSLPLVIKDEDLLKTIFQDHYGYHTLTPCKQLGYAVGRKQWQKILTSISEELDQEKKYDGLILVYNGHGESGRVVLSDGKKYSMEKICGIFDNETLDNWCGKPRIIIKLACRGKGTGLGIQSPKSKNPYKQDMWYCTDQDFITIYANTEGNVVKESINPRENKGSAFVEALTELANLKNNLLFKSNFDEILGMLGTKVRNMMQGTECLEWKKTFFSTLYLSKRTHVQHSTQQQSNTTLQDLEERKSPDDPILQDTKQQQSNLIIEELDDEKSPDEPNQQDTKQGKQEDKPSFNVETLKLLIKTAIDKVENKETLHKLQNNDMAYFFGNTGAGKSTIINYLLGNELEKYCPEDEKNLNTNDKHLDNPINTNTQNDSDSDSDDFTCGVQSKQKAKIFRIRRKDPNAIGPKIGQNAVQSETAYPCPYFPQNLKKSLGFCDTAGFSDTKGIENIVCTYIGNNLIIQKSNKLKAICFLTYKQALEIGRGQPFLNSVIETISNLIKETKDCNPLDSIFIVLNNKSNINNDTLVVQVFDMLNDFKRGFKQKKKNDQQNAQQYQAYIDILKKILKDSSNKETMRILAIDPLDDGTSRKDFLQRINTSPIIPKQNLKKLASKQGEEKVKSLQKEMLSDTKPILDHILDERKHIQAREQEVSTSTQQIQQFNKTKSTLQQTLQELEKKSQQAKKSQEELAKKILKPQEEVEKLQQKIKELEPGHTSSDYSKETNKLLSQYDHMINHHKEKISRFEKKQDDIYTDIKRLQHKVEDKNERIDEFSPQLEKEAQQIQQLEKENKQLLDITQDRIITLAQNSKNWFDYYQEFLEPISKYWWTSKKEEQHVFSPLKKAIDNALKACNRTSLTRTDHTNNVRSVAFNPSGRWLASASRDKTIKVWDTQRWACKQTLKGHTDTVFSVAFDPSGRWLASGSSDHTIKVWDTQTWACQQTLKGHTDTVYSVAFDPKGRWLASGSYDKTIKVWDTQTWACKQTLKGHTNSSVYSVAFDPKGTLLASASSDDTIKVWDTQTWACQQTLKGHTFYIRVVAFDPKGRWLASGSYDYTIKVWDTQTWACKQTLKGHTNTVFSVAFDPKGRWLASASWDNTIQVWDTQTWACKQTLTGHTDAALSVAFNPSGTLLASASNDDTIKLWDIPTLLGHNTAKYHIPLLDRDRFKLQTDSHLKKVKAILNHYYQDTIQALRDSTAQKTKKILQTNITSLEKKITDQKAQENTLKKQIDDIRSKIDNLQIQKLKQIEKEIQQKQKRDQLSQLTQKKEKLYKTLHELQKSQHQHEDTFHRLVPQLKDAQSSQALLLEKISREETDLQKASDAIELHQKELKQWKGMLQRKQPSIDLILKIDNIVPMGIITKIFIQNYLKCKVNHKHR